MEELLSSDFFSADFIANGSSEELNFREFEFNSEPTQVRLYFIVKLFKKKKEKKVLKSLAIFTFFVCNSKN